MKKSNFISPFLLLIALLITIPGSSQRASFRNIKVNYIHLPLYPLDPQYKTYQPILNLVLPDDTKEIDQLTNQYLKIPGYQKTDNNPDLQIQVTFGEFKVAEKMLHTDDVYNVNAGKNLTGYLYNVKCEYSVKLLVTTLAGDELCNMEILPEEKILHFEFGKWEYSKENLDAKYQNEAPQILLEKQYKCISQVLSQVRKVLNSYYGNAVSSERIKIASGKGRKYDYSDLDNAAEIFQGAMGGTVDLLVENEERNSGLQKAREIWMTRIQKDEPTREKEGTSQEVFQMLWYNCAISYFWQNEFDKAREALSFALEMIHDKTSKSNIKILNELEELIPDMEKRYYSNKNK